jgi:succinylglutamate desuccinylase
MDAQRIIGRYAGKEKGPLLVCLGGMHGNEPAGIKALEVIFQMLQVEPLANPGFSFRGCILGLRGNLQAISREMRFIEKDLNRLWTLDNISRIRDTPFDRLDVEDREVKELLDVIEQEIRTYQPDKLVLIDLHTTTAKGGIFTIATDDPESVRIGVELHAPVIKGMLRGIQGTTLHYFHNGNLELPTAAVCFESGQHEEQLSVNRAISAIINCMRTIGCVRPDDVENRHDALLIEYSKDLPKVAEMIMCHRIMPGDDFQMLPDFRNFQPVKRGELLARDRHGEIRAQADGFILMPLYQPQGDDGFFLVRAIDGF